MPWLIGAMTAPIDPGCFEWCGLGRDFAAFGFLVVVLVWLLVVLVVAWSWRVNEPTVAAVSAVAAGPLLLLVGLRLSGIASYEVITDQLVVLAWVVSLGLQLPPVWRLSQRASPSGRLRMVVLAMNLAVAVATFAIVFLGTGTFSDGPNVVFACWVIFVGCLIAISVAAWRDGASPPVLVGPLLAATLPVLLVPIAIAAPGDILYVLLLVFPLSALAWLWIAIGWLRRGGAQMTDGGDLAAEAPTD
jgi:hypothetical protein